MPTISHDLLYTQIDVFPTYNPPRIKEPEHEITNTAHHIPESSNQLFGLMQELVSTQDRQTMLLEQLVGLLTSGHRQRVVELGLWKLAHPELAEYCKKAAKKLERVHNDLLSTITEEVEANSENFFDNEYSLSEFVDRFGSKFIQLEAILRVLQQLGNAPDIQIAANDIK
ncbi:hypothetical protein FACS189454_04710 [Planctomycetales bacterium]|nr:hypothetical protein FACS189454_04710 [Planctomycetales bacterium]